MAASICRYRPIRIRHSGHPLNTIASIDPDTGDQIIDSEFHARVFHWGGSLQYSMPYLKSAVVDLGLPDFFNH